MPLHRHLSPISQWPAGVIPACPAVPSKMSRRTRFGSGRSGEITDVSSPLPPSSPGAADGAGFDPASTEISLQRSAQMLRRLDDTLRRTRHLVGRDRVVDLREDPPSDRPDRPLRLLIVDDNAVIRHVLSTLFEAECGDSLEIRTAASGAEALSAAPWNADVIVLDWLMPGMDGLETARRLRRRGVRARVVVYSSAPAAEGAPQALDAGADRYLEKGSDADGLVRAVTEVLEGAGVGPAGSR